MRLGFVCIYNYLTLYVCEFMAFYGVVITKNTL